MNLLKRNIAVLFMALCTTWVWAQLPVYTCDFEDPAENNEWVLNMGRMRLLNMWFVGPTGDFDVNGNNGLYISRDDNGVDPTYNATNTMFVTAAREMPDMPAGKYRLYFDWKCAGKKGTSEGLYVCYVPLETITSSAASAGGLPLWVTDYQCDSVFSGSTQWSVGQVDIEHDGTPHKLVLVWYNTQGAVSPPAACVDNLELRPLPATTGEPLCPAPHDVTHILNGDTVILDWHGEANYYDLRCYDNNNDLWFVQNHLTVPQCTIAGISEGVHTFIIRAHCSDTTASDYEQYTQLIFHKGTRCIEYLDLNWKCYTGAYTTRKPNSKPFSKQEKVDYGFDNMQSRHTIHYMPDEYDANTNYELPTVPDGFLASVRLGDAGFGGTLGTGNGVGESIEYKYEVQDGASSILKIWYAVVLSNPHPEEPEKNPQFWLDVLCDGRSIANECGFAFFTAGDGDGWKQGAEGTLSWLYRPWTEHAINLRDYVGKTLTIRLVTTDCEPSGHTGYAYFVLDCESGEMSGLNCGEDNPTTDFKAPSGFDYVWYPADNHLDTLSTEQTFSIQPMDTNAYCVNVINKNNANCWYTLTALGKPRIPTPLADYTASVQNCQNMVTFTNKSCITLQNMQTNRFEQSSEPVTSLVWDFGDGTVETSDTYIGATIQHAYPPEGGRFVVKLTAGISNDACVVTDSIVLNLPNVYTLVTEIHEDLCRADYPFGYKYADQWWTEDVDSVFTFTSAAGCDSLCHLLLRFHDVENTALVDTICEGYAFDFFGKQLTQSGQYTETTASMYGCDSIVQLSLHVEPMLQVTIQDSFSVCVDDKVMEIPYEIIQGSMDSMMVLFDSLALREGMKERYVFVAGEIPTISLPDSITPNIYAAVLNYTNSLCDIQPDTIWVELTYSSSIAQVKTDVLAIQNDDYNGGYAFDSIQWYRAGEPIPGATTANLSVSAEDRGVEFTVKLRRHGEQVMIGSCPIVYLPTDVQAVELPTMNWPLYVYNILGVPLGKITLHEFTNLPSGIYLLSDGKNTLKVIL